MTQRLSDQLVRRLLAVHEVLDIYVAGRAADQRSVVAEDLDVLVELCDRIMVISSGRVSGIVDGRTATKEEIGLLMTKAENEEKGGTEGGK
jgi:ABC-type uncharacterized transport system ATPase subunit